MKRDVRLRSLTEFQRVRRFGKSFAHPFVVLLVLPVEQPVIKIGVAAGRSVGGAVKRNRAKRRIRAILDEYIPLLQPGFHLMVMAREAVNRATYLELRAALRDVLIRAQLLKESDEFSGNTNAGIST